MWSFLYNSNDCTVILGQGKILNIRVLFNFYSASLIFTIVFIRKYKNKKSFFKAKILLVSWSFLIKKF